MMEKVKEILENYYNNYDEDSRLVKDKTHTIEFITTTKFIDKYLKKGDKKKLLSEKNNHPNDNSSSVLNTNSISIVIT